MNNQQLGNELAKDTLIDVPHQDTEDNEDNSVLKQVIKDTETGKGSAGEKQPLSTENSNPYNLQTDISNLEELMITTELE